MIRLHLDFLEESFSLEGEIGQIQPNFYEVPEGALILVALAKLKKTLIEKANEKIIVEVSGSRVNIKREGKELVIPSGKVVAMLDMVRKSVMQGGFNATQKENKPN